MIISALSWDELLRLLAMARACRERDWLLLALSTNHALRASEAVQLRVDDVSQHGIRIVGLKGGDTVTQPLVRHPEALLNEATPLLDFICGRVGNQKVFDFGRHRFWELMQKYGADCDLPPQKRHPHSLRHTCAMYLKDRGVPLDEMQAWMRHKSLGSTGVYLRPTQEQVNGNVLRAMGAL